MTNKVRRPADVHRPNGWTERFASAKRLKPH